MIGALLMLAGVLAGYGAARLPSVAWIAAAGAALLLAWVPSVRTVPGIRRLAALLAGLLLASAVTHRWVDLRVLPERVDARLLVEGRVTSVPARRGNALHFDAEVVVVEGTLDRRPRRARLSWREPTHEPRVGERWRWLIEPAAHSRLHNFAGHDAGRVAFRDGIHLSARVVPAALNGRVELARYSIDVARARIATRIVEEVADPAAAALITALAVGLTDGMSLDQWRVFNATGTTHLVAISGLHVTLFALLSYAVARWTWRVLPQARRVARETFALVAGLIAAFGYAWLAGLSVPTQRTWLMLAIFALARLQARHAGPARTWGLALVAVLLLDPRAPLAAGFWLSFVAVGVILIVEMGVASKRGWLHGALRVQLAVTIALAPLTIAVFGGVSLAGLWVNLIAIPLISFLLVPLILAGALAALFAPGVCGVFFGAAALLHHGAWPALVMAADSEYALWRVMPPAPWFLAALPAALVLMLRWPWMLRASGCVALMPLLFAPSRLPATGTVRVSLLDAGTGAAALIVTQSHVLLFDTGDRWGTRGSRVSQVVIPALDAIGADGVDLLVLPALDTDRARGVALLADQRALGRVIAGGGWPAARLPVRACRDERFTRDGVEFRLLAAGRYCVLRVAAGPHAILFAGDLDATAERALLRRLPPRSLASDVAVLGRHGTALASSDEWIEASGAATSVAAGGIESQSRARVQARWAAAGAAGLATGRDGGIEIEMGTHGVSIRTARAARHPFAWRRSQ